MNGHTPGPWIAVGAWVEHPDDDVADICSCDPATINQEHLGRGYSEICANARLIAAAPAMHAEIERLQRIIDSRPVINAGNDLLPCPFCGGRAEMDTMTPFTSIFTGMSETGISAYCTDCSAEIMVCRPDVPDVTEEMVAEMWNTRA